MLFDALNFSNNSMIELLREFINSCQAETIVTPPVINGLVTTDLLKHDPINFLLAIPFTIDSTRMEGIRRTGKDVACITNGIIHMTSFHDLRVDLLIV